MHSATTSSRPGADPLKKSHWQLGIPILTALASLWSAQSRMGDGAEESAGGNTTGAERPALIVAVERGQATAVEQLIKNGSDLEVRTPDGVTPLYAAAYHGRTAILRRLIAAGAKVDGRAACGRTPLFTAAAEGRVGAVEALLEAGADPNARSDTNELAQTPLHMAAVEGQVETAKRLLERGAKVNAWSDRHHLTPVYLAAIAGHQPLAALLRARGADATIADIFGQTPDRASAVSRGEKVAPTPKGSEHTAGI